MNIEDIKIGETYNIRATVVDKSPKGWIEIQAIDEKYSNILSVNAAEAFSPISHENCIKNTETTPKYDPCREFRAGDKVELKTNLGRNPYDTFDGQEYIPDGTVFTVLRDEWAGGKVDIFEKDESDAFTVHFSNLELVTPVEELDPYFIEETEYEYCVSIMVGERKDIPATYHKRMHPHAKEAAEAECTRLNAEYRKEQSND